MITEVPEAVRMMIARRIDAATDWCWADLGLWAVFGHAERFAEAEGDGKECRAECPCWCQKFGGRP